MNNLKVTRKLFLFILVGIFLVSFVNSAIVENFTTNTTWTVPIGVTEIMVEAWGGGGVGGGGRTNNNAGGGGGAGGQYARANLTVIPGQSFTLTVSPQTVHPGGNNVGGPSGGTTEISNATATYVRAVGGAGGGRANLAPRPGGVGTTTGGIGDVVYAGGSGGAGTTTASGGGAGGAGSTGNGGSGSGTTAGTGTSELGGNGGVGLTATASGNAGSNYGGGGSGARRAQLGGSGAQGYLRITYTPNEIPTIENITLSTILIKGGNQIVVYANTTSNGVNDTDLDPLTIYCSNLSNPSTTNNLCSSADASYPYEFNCAYNTKIADENETVYCRVYDGASYSQEVNATYMIDSSPPSLSIVSVAGDSNAPYLDTSNDGVTLVNVSGEEGMSCRWSSNDISYSAMVSSCTIGGIYASCNFNNILSQGFTTRYISCIDSLTNENNATNNLDVEFILDYTAPTTSSNSISFYQLVPYVVTITESDNVDGDPTTYYCTSSTEGCNPTTLIDNLETITYTAANRGRNYLRYYSVDQAGNSQIIVNETININRLPVLVSVQDNATTIGPNSWINVSTNSYDLDSGQQMNLFVCSSPSATSSGCAASEYCSVSGTVNLSCEFESENSTGSYTWYSFIFDELGEAALNNPLSGLYSVDSDGPVITIISPPNQSYESAIINAEISTSESSVWAGYSLNGQANDTMSVISSTSFVATLESLTVGQYNITFYANDSFGNMGASAVRYFSVVEPADILPPVLTIVSPANASYNNPWGTYVNSTSNEDLSWAGYSLNSAPVELMSNSSKTNWFVNLTNLNQESSNTIVIYGNDTSNNQANVSRTFFADSLAPRYSLVSATPNPTNQSIGVNCSIYWEDGFNITLVRISENSLGSHENHTILFSGKNGTASYFIPGVKLGNIGTYECIFYATDIAGNSNSTSIEFVVQDVIAPTITPTSPSNNGVYATAEVSFSIISNEALSSAWYSINSTGLNYSMASISLTAWAANFSGADGESYLIRYYGNDSSGNVGFSNEIVFSIDTEELDSIPPVLTSTIANGSYLKATDLTFNVSSNENLSWAGYSLNGADLEELTNFSETLWNGTLSGLGEEEVNIIIFYGNDSADKQGNLTVIFYSDVLAPRFIDPEVLPSDVLNETQSTTCNVYINDSFGFSRIRIAENATTPGIFINHTIDLDSAGYANHTINNLQKGSYSCIFYAIDVAGNSNSTSVSFSVNDVTAPVLTIASPLEQTYTSQSISFILTSNEALIFANYSLNGGANISMSGSGTLWTKTQTLSDGIYEVVFYGADSSGNLATVNRSFVVDFSSLDTTLPQITIWSPLTQKYYTSEEVVLNITSTKDLSWAGYRLNSGSLEDLENVSLRNWNKTVSLTEGFYNLTFYANDTTTNKNQGTRNISFYVDLNNPSVDSFVCDSSVNDSKTLICNGTFSDSIGLDYAILSYNFSGSFVNSSGFDLVGTSDELNYTFLQGNYTPGIYAIQIYLFDLAGRINDSEIVFVEVLDDVAPSINSVIYFPTNQDDLDPGVNVTINASVIEDYKIGDVFVYYTNDSGTSWIYEEMTNTSLENYNVTLLDLSEGNWTFYVNASDLQRNINISQNYSFVVSYDVSQILTTTIPLISSFTYAQRSSANLLGNLILNTTSDLGLNYSVVVSANADILGRFNLNNTLNQTENYSAGNGVVLQIPIYVNLTDLTQGFYPFNVTVSSEAGAEIFERNLNIQTAKGPYLVATVSSYSSSVTRGQTNIELVASVSNFGTQSASDVILTWNLPSAFTLTQGDLTRNIGNLAIGQTATNTIRVSVSSSVSDSVVNITASATGIGVDDFETKSISILDPLVIEIPGETIILPGGGGGGSGSGGQAVVYSKIIQLARGETNRFEIEVLNKYSNTTLENLKISLTGFDSKYISISPETLNRVRYNERGFFVVTFSAPSYKSYEEHNLRAVITGTLVSGQTRQSYSETQNIKLIIQEVSNESAFENLKLAEEAINEMIDAGFNVENLESLLRLGNLDLESWKNLDAEQKALEIIRAKELAFKVKERLENIQKEIASLSLVESPITGKITLVSGAIQDLLEMALLAFERGDYVLAEQRINSLQSLLALEKKGNLYVFVYLYWHYIAISIIVLLLFLVVLFRYLRKKRISQRILEINKEENHIRRALGTLQTTYYSGKIGIGLFNASRARYNNQLAKLKKERLNLRNKIISLVSGEKVHAELVYERRETEKEIKELQHRFYNQKKIPENVYKTQFDILGERLAEIEEEKLSLEMLEVRKASKKERFSKIKEKIRNREKRKEEERKKKVEELLEKTSSDKK